RTTALDGERRRHLGAGRGAAGGAGRGKLPRPRRADAQGGGALGRQGAAEAVVAGTVDFLAVETMPAEGGIAHLTAIPGVGPWTAEIYLLFCVGHPDIFPAGDLALKKAARDGLGLAQLPDTRTLIEIAETWSPHRGAAALLLWRYFHALYDRIATVV